MALQCKRHIAIAVLCSGFIVSSHGAVVYDESVNGDLSNSGASPTLVSVAAGDNEILGTTGRTQESPIDLDYFRISVPAGLQLSSLFVLPGTNNNGSFSFIAVQSGTQVTVPPTTATAAGLLGWWHYQTTGLNSDLNKDILPAMGFPANGSTGFTPPLPAGDYSFWVQDADFGAAHYHFNLVLSQVPEPGTVSIALVGLIIALAAVRVRRPDA